MSDQKTDTHQQVARLERELAHVRLALEDFTHSVSHDLRASLRHVNAYVRIAREDLGDAIDPGIASHLDTAAGAATHMGRLMDGLMELSRVGRAELQAGDVDLGRLIEDARQQLESDADGRVIRWSIAQDLPCVQGDVALLGQMFHHLFDNAIKFTRDCPVTRIGVTWQALDNGYCALQIQDNGVGFDPRMQDRLFRVFQSLHSARQFDGIGIGLALARRVVERHGGMIRAEGAPDQGCCISLSLPMTGGAGSADGRQTLPV